MAIPTKTEEIPEGPAFILRGLDLYYDHRAICEQRSIDDVRAKVEATWHVHNDYWAIPGRDVRAAEKRKIAKLSE